MSPNPPDQHTTAALEARIEALEWIVGVLAQSVAAPPGKRVAFEPMRADDCGGSRITRTPNKNELPLIVQNELDRLGLGDLDFRVM